MLTKKLLTVLIVVLLLSPLAAIAAEEGPPKFGGYQVTVQNPEILISTADKAVNIEIPILGKQREDKNWVICASYAYAGKDKWFLVAQEKYELETKLLNHTAKAILPLPEKETWFWIRAWGKNDKGEWMHINQASSFCRPDKKGQPGYEFLVNIKDRITLPVSSSYEIRK